jgi:hypothetical protein
MLRLTALSLRTRGFQFIMVTLAFAQMVYYFAQSLLAQMGGAVSPSAHVGGAVNPGALPFAAPSSAVSLAPTSGLGVHQVRITVAIISIGALQSRVDDGAPVLRAIGRWTSFFSGWVSARRKKPLDRKRSLRIVGIGFCVTSIARPYGGAQLYER